MSGRFCGYFLVALLGMSLASCDVLDRPKNPREYFLKNKAGASADYGIVKWNDPLDHVVTVHGFMDDFKVCGQLADALNKDACAETNGENCLNPFSCEALNH